MNEVFIVFGSTGEYSDHRSWPVRAFATLAEADQFAVECQKEADSIWNADNGSDWDKYSAARAHLRRNKPKCDPNLRFDYTGTDYHVSGPLPFGKQE